VFCWAGTIIISFRCHHGALWYAVAGRMLPEDITECGGRAVDRLGGRLLNSDSNGGVQSGSWRKNDAGSGSRQ
jgi:hypothetical protein